MDDKFRLEDFGLYIEEGHDHPATPNIERKTMPIPGMDGVWDFGTEIREKPFNLPLATQVRDRPKLQQSLNNFVAFLFDEYGKPREIKLVYDYEPDKFYMVKVSDQFSPERIRPFARFMLPLVADDGHKFSNVYADEVTWGSTDITFEADYLFGHTNDLGGSIKVTRPQTFNITVSGLAVQLIFEIEGTANNLTISCGKHEFTLPNFVNTKWIIDFEKYVVFRNGQDTMIEIRNFYLLKGNNEISVNGSNINIELRVKFRDKYN